MDASQDKLNQVIRTTIGDLVVQTIMLNAQLEQANQRIADLVHQLDAQNVGKVNGGKHHEERVT